jgi:PiT family inorganic phosphate transporter
VIGGIFLLSRRRPHDHSAAMEVDVAATSVLSRRRARRAEKKGRVDTPAGGVEAPFVRLDDPPAAATATADRLDRDRTDRTDDGTTR